MGTGRATALSSVLDRLETAYGRLVAPQDPVEAGVLALLASHAPLLATDASRDRLRSAFADWNEARVADPWDLTTALEASADPSARAFARATLRYLEALHGALNRCSFDVPENEPKPDFVALVEKARGVPPEARAVVLASLPETGGWHLSADMARIAVKLGLAGKTTSAAKAAQSLAETCPAEDRLRLQYLLAKYAAREKDDPDPLAATPKSKRPADARRGASSRKPAKSKGAAK